jgi:hypothetical protein
MHKNILVIFSQIFWGTDSVVQYCLLKGMYSTFGKRLVKVIMFWLVDENLSGLPVVEIDPLQYVPVFQLYR